MTAHMHAHVVVLSVTITCLSIQQQIMAPQTSSSHRSRSVLAIQCVSMHFSCMAASTKPSSHSPPCIPCHAQAFEASAEQVKTVEQQKGALLPITVEKPTVELVKVTKDMKVGGQCRIS